MAAIFSRSSSLLLLTLVENVHKQPLLVC